MRNVMCKIRVSTARELLAALIDMSKLCEANMDTIYIERTDMLTLIEETLSSGLKVYNIQTAEVGPDLRR